MAARWWGRASSLAAWPAGRWWRPVLFLAMTCWLGMAQAQLSWWFKGPADFAEVHQVIADKFPGVAQITTAELAAQTLQGGAPLLLDYRSRAEYEVSHLPGAVWVRDLAMSRAEIARVRSLDPQRKVVFYCSVGYRSAAAIAELHRLPDKGFGSGLFNLKGSIFQWANEGRPLARRVAGAEVPASTVHPYDAKWAPLLLPALRATP